MRCYHLPDDSKTGGWLAQSGDQVFTRIQCSMRMLIGVYIVSLGYVGAIVQRSCFQHILHVTAKVNGDLASTSAQPPA